MTTTQTNPQPDKSNKKTVSEVGHSKNVANFKDLIAYCTAYGAAYNPPANNLKIASLNTLLTSA